MTESSGLAIIKDNCILLVKNANILEENNYSIPKGIIEKGESKIETAIRETYEETGLLIKPSQIVNDFKEIRIIINDSHVKTVYYSILFLDLSNHFIPRPIDVGEISSANFFSKREALILLNWRYRQILFQF